jgi:ABC-type multidrug transport system ATPase subunit
VNRGEPGLPPPVPAPDGGGAIAVDSLTVGYRRGKPVLHGVSFSVGPGEIAAIVGPNGSGKTTLFRVLMGFLAPWQGTVRLGGVAPGVHLRRHGVAFLPDSIAVPPGWSGLALLREGVRRSRVPPGGQAAELARAVERTGLSVDALTGPADDLSKGMSRRVVAAMVLAGAPSPVLLDEPLTGLDAPSRVALRQEILECAQGGAAVLMASHDLDEVQRMATRVVLLRNGVVEEILEGRRSVRDAGLEQMVVGDPEPRPLTQGELP